MFKNQKGTAESNEAKRFDYEVEVETVRPTKKDDLVMVDIRVNGVSIKSCMLKELTVKKDGEKYKKGDTCYVLQFPQEKVGDKYYNRVWFPVSNETIQNIVDQVEKML